MLARAGYGIASDLLAADHNYSARLGPRAVVAVLRRLGPRMGVSRTGPQPSASLASGAKPMTA